ncbi:NfeD family protein [Fusobacterium sp. PH5-44]|uniref:NfeD family protein n=1 Tax=unclassified Fusobacterium TaxID=2648384 RepID=UPI003D1A688B
MAIEHSYIWLIAMVIFLIIEAIVPGLVSIWCAISAAITAFLSYYIKDLRYQVYIFLILSIILFGVTRKYITTYMDKKNNQADNKERIIGQIVEIRDISSNNTYNIYLDGKHWTGISDESFSKGDKARVRDIKGIKLVLENLNENI